MTLAVGCDGSTFWLKGTSQRPSLLLRNPLMINFPFLKIFKLFFVNIAVQPLSQSCPMERRDALVSAGKTCAFLASLDNALNGS